VTALCASYPKKACLQKTRYEERRDNEFDNNTDNHIASAFRFTVILFWNLSSCIFYFTGEKKWKRSDRENRKNYQQSSPLMTHMFLARVMHSLRYSFRFHFFTDVK